MNFTGTCLVAVHPKCCCDVQEVRSTVKARKLGVRTPVVYYVEHEASTIYMEKVLGTSLKDLLLQSQLTAEGTYNRDATEEMPMGS